MDNIAKFEFVVEGMSREKADTLFEMIMLYASSHGLTVSGCVNVEKDNYIEGYGYTGGLVEGNLFSLSGEDKYHLSGKDTFHTPEEGSSNDETKVS